MKLIKALLLLFLTALVFRCDTVPIVEIDPTTEPETADVLLIGRFDMSDPAGPKASWSASTIKANFEGSEILADITSSGDNWFNVIIDGNVQSPVNITPSTAQPVLLATGLSAGAHTIELVKRTEGNQGEIQFRGFTFRQGGNLLATPAASDRRIEFVGDSITCGYGNEGTSQYQSFTPKNENAYLAYGSVTARILDADQTTVSVSGIGMTRNYDGNTAQTMPVLYPRTLTWNPNLLWDYTNWIPDVVVINLCTNDFNSGIPDRNHFTATYMDFVSKMRRQYANAVIYCALGPMLYGENLNSARDYISSVVNQLTIAGDAKVKFIEFPMQNETNGYGEDWHPSIKTHELMANQLAAQIRTDLGW